jgi:glycosyltransferase involved in cell wall biosynthesis
MILIIQGTLPHYRIGFFNALCDIDEVTVVHSGRAACGQNLRFREVVLPVRRVGPFRIQFGLHRLIRSIDPNVVIAMFDLRWLSSIQAMYKFDRHLTWVWWGLGEGQFSVATWIKTLLANRINPIVFYSDRSWRAFHNRLTEPGRLFVARNTLDVLNRTRSYLSPEKSIFLNVGSLDARKRNDVTIRVIRRLVDSGIWVPKFVLVGEGGERGRLAQLVAELEMQDYVDFVGFSDDPEVIASYYRIAIASVSFGQAGLAVLQSMAHGVPFVATQNAISSGESENIIDGKTGILCEESPLALEQALRGLLKDPDRARRMGAAAYDHFSRTATLENMVARFKEAIDYGAKRKR